MTTNEDLLKRLEHDPINTLLNLATSNLDNTQLKKFASMVGLMDFMINDLGWKSKSKADLSTKNTQ